MDGYPLPMSAYPLLLGLTYPNQAKDGQPMVTCKKMIWGEGDGQLKQVWIVWTAGLVAPNDK